MHGHHGARQQQLVFHQGGQVELGAADQQVFLAVLVLGVGLGLVGDKAEPLRHLHRLVQVGQAALANHRQTRVSLQVQPGLATAAHRLAPFALCLPVHGQVAGFGFVTQTGVSRQGILRGQCGARAGKGQNVEAAGIKDGTHGASVGE